MKRTTNPGWKRYPTSYGVYKVKRRGNTWVVRTPDGSEFPYSSREAALKHFAGYKKKNPGLRRLTKTQRKARTKKLSAKRRVANALKAYLQRANPGRKLAGAKVQKNKGSITIVPVFLKKRK